MIYFLIDVFSPICRFLSMIWRPANIVWRVGDFVWLLGDIVWLPGVMLWLFCGLFKAILHAPLLSMLLHIFLWQFFAKLKNKYAITKLT